MKLDSRDVRVLGPFVVGFLFLLTVPGYLATFVWGTVVFTGNAETDAALLVQSIFGGHGFPVDMLKVIIGSLPALLGVVCFRAGDDRFLSRTGWWSLWILLAGAVVAFVAVWRLDPLDPLQAGRLSDGADGIRRLHGGAEASLRYAVTYGMLLLGLQVEVKK